MKKLLNILYICLILITYGAYAAQVSDDRIISYCTNYALPTPIENIVCDYLDENDVTVEQRSRVMSVEQSCINDDAFNKKHDWYGFFKSVEEPDIDSYEMWKSKQSTPYNYTPVFLPAGGFFMMQLPDYNRTSYASYRYYVATKESEIARIRAKKAERELELHLRKELEKVEKEKEIKEQTALAEEYTTYCKSVANIPRCEKSFAAGDYVVDVSMRNQARELRTPYQKPAEPVIQPVQELAPVPVMQEPTQSQTQPIEKPVVLVPPVLPSELPAQPVVNSESQRPYVKSFLWKKPAVYFAVASVACISFFLWYFKKTK